jgi:hypothetical protein
VKLKIERWNDPHRKGYSIWTERGRIGGKKKYITNSRRKEDHGAGEELKEE